MKFSIVVPVKENNSYLEENVERVLQLNDKGVWWEMLILPNDSFVSHWLDDRIRVISTGRCGPAEKRNIGASHSRGDYIVFLDDDSWPPTEYLQIAKSILSNLRHQILGGPGVTPPNDGFWQQVSGAVFSTKLSGGFPERYFPVGKPHLVDEWPTVNLIIKKTLFDRVGGFKSRFWPGEDTLFCRDLLLELGERVFYHPELIVYHHRRSGLIEHAIQIYRYGKHRGYFFKMYPEISRKLKFVVPSLFVIFNIASLGILVVDGGAIINAIFSISWSGYLILLVHAGYRSSLYSSIKISLAAVPLIYLTHVSYGSGFFVGICSNKLQSKLR